MLKPLLACLALGLGGIGTLCAETASAVPAPTLAGVTWGGFVQVWAAVGEDSAHRYDQSGLLLKHLRLKMTGPVADGIKAVLVPEFAGGVTVLDAYMQLDLARLLPDLAPPLDLTLGQFKTPFGQDRMALPSQLAIVDYAMLTAPGVGVMESASAWDDGAELTLRPKAFRWDLAVVEGRGPNQAKPNGSAYGLKDGQDVSSRLDIPILGESLAVGGSLYYGELYSTPGVAAYPGQPRLFSGAHARAKLGEHAAELQAEYMARGVDRGGVYLQWAQWLGAPVQAVLAYARTQDYRSDAADATRWVAGLNWSPKPHLRFSLDAIGESAGPSETPVSAKAVLQSQAAW